MNITWNWGSKTWDLRVRHSARGYRYLLYYDEVQKYENAIRLVITRKIYAEKLYGIFYPNVCNSIDRDNPFYAKALDAIK